MHVHDVLLKALVSEKSMKENENGKYTFLVHKEADKKQIRYAVKHLFHVDAVQILTTNVKGRTKRTGPKRIVVKQSTFKKAVIRLKAGQTLGGSPASEKKDEKKPRETGGLLSKLKGKK